MKTEKYTCEREAIYNALSKLALYILQGEDFNIEQILEKRRYMETSVTFENWNFITDDPKDQTVKTLKLKLSLEYEDYTNLFKIG